MRNRTLILTGALLLLSSGVAWAQQEQPSAAPAAAQGTPTAAPAPDVPNIGRVSVGFRGDSVDGDAARYQRFKDRRDGAFLDGFRLQKETDTWFFRGEANNVGYRDQQFFAGFEAIGKFKAIFDWNQIPLFITEGRSLYTRQGSLLAVDDAIQQQIQAGTLTLTDALRNNVNTYDLRSRRDNGAFNLVYTVNRDIDFKFDVRTSSREGYNLQAFLFGTSPGGSPVIDMGLPIDDRTTDVKGMFEFASDRGLFAIGYNGSWYNNNLPLVQFENPLRFTAISGGASVGQAVTWPANTQFAFVVNGSYKMPRRSRASAFISVGRVNQDEELAAPTVNTALVAPPLMRRTADASADVMSMLYSFTSRPIDNVSFNARYRFYDYDNKTADFEATQLLGDWALGSALWENEPNSFKRHTFDVDANFNPHRYAGFSVGYARESADRTFRIFETTSEDTFRVSFDTIGNQYVSLRAKYEHSNRDGTGFDEREGAHSGLELLEEVGEQPTMRHYDVANRKRDRSTLMFNVTPTGWLDLNVSASMGKDDYVDTGFGLRDNKNNTWSVGFDVVPIDTVSFGLNYGFEKYDAQQWSRAATDSNATIRNQQFTDSTPAGPGARDWWLDQTDEVKTFTVSLDLLKALPKTDIRIGYDISDGDATYVYNLNPNQTIFTAAAPLQQLAPLKNKLTDARFDIQYFVRPNIAIGGAYWYEDYKVQDFALNDTVINQLNATRPPAPGQSEGAFAATIYSGYLYRPYTAHTGLLRLTYLW